MQSNKSEWRHPQWYALRAHSKYPKCSKQIEPAHFCVNRQCVLQGQFWRKKVCSIHQPSLRTTHANFLNLYTYRHRYCTHFKVCPSGIISSCYQWNKTRRQKQNNNNIKAETKTSWHHWSGQQFWAHLQYIFALCSDSCLQQYYIQTYTTTSGTNISTEKRRLCCKMFTNTSALLDKNCL